MAITNAQQYQQLVNKPANGKRPGYRGVGEYQSGRSKAGTKGSQFEKGPNVGRDPKESPPVDKSSALQTFNQQVSRGTQLPPQLQGPIPLNKREKLLKDFIDRRPKQNFPLGIFDILSGGKFRQKFANFSASKNRPFFEKVIRGGKFELPGELGKKYGNLDIFDLNKMTDDELEEAYDAYDKARLGGEIFAFGNKKPLRDDNDAYIFPRSGIMAGDASGLSDTDEVAKKEDDSEAQNFRLLAGGGMAERAPYEGGIMDLESARQMYGLGKLVKKITRSVKKIAKSPLGKVAIGAALFQFGKPLVQSQGFKNFFLKDAAKGFSLANLSTKGALTGIAGISALGGLTAEEDDEEQLYAGADLPNPVDFYLSGKYPSNMRLAAEGGLMRQNYDEAGAVMSEKEMKKLAKSPLYKGFKTMYGVDPNMAKDNEKYEGKFEQFEQLFKKGYQKGGDVEPVAKKTMPLLDMGGMEKDYREEGGFVPIGRMEKADDVPARLSKNEFVFTADAVRNAGDGDVDLGAEKMYNMMKNLEAGGDVSEESQGMDGARKMFQTSQRLEEVL